MGNTHVKPHPRPRNKKQVHWKAADRPSPPGKPHLSSENELTPDLVTILWSKPVRDGGSPVTGYLVEHRRTGSPHWVRATPLLVPFPELTISGLEPGWRYQFRVRAENAVGLSDPSEISEPLTVTLQKYAITAPKFVEELKDMTVLENEKVEFIVHFLGQPAPKICWFKDGFEIFSSRRARILTENDKSVLTIHQSALSDEGEIKCTATNKAGHASTKARLSLEAPPSIRLPRQYEEGLLFEIGEVLRLKVSVAGRPTPLVFWSHNGESIQNDDRYEIEYVDKSSILKLGEARRSDRGEYQIKAVNKVGEDVVSFLVTITDKPSPPGKARVVMTLGRSVTLSWSTPEDDGGCKIGNYIVEYYRLGWNVWLKAATSRQLTTILGDLIEGSEYKFRIKAESPYGVSDPSEESEIVFIPDAKRGITSPEARSKSQPKDLIDEIAAPIATKRKIKEQARSVSSSAKADTMTEIFEETPKRPDRNKIKSPPKTPDMSPKNNRKEVSTFQANLDRASLARELAYGSPEIKMKRTELNLPQKDDFSTKTSPSISPVSSIKDTSPEFSQASSTSSPNRSFEEEKTPSTMDKRRFVREKSENFEESSEFMLVLYPDANEKGQRKESGFDFDEFDIPPPISLSAPELGVEPPIFNNLKPSASSTELLYERAMLRFNKAAAAEEEEKQKRKKYNYDRQPNFEIPKIQINSKDDQDIVGLERKPSRRKSSGSIVQQQILWAQRRFSLKKTNDLDEIVENRLQKSARNNPSKQEMISRQKSESEEREEEEFALVRAKMALQGQSSTEKRNIEVVDEDKWLEDYEESVTEEETESSEDERQFDEEPPPMRINSDEDEDEETYHPGFVSIPKNANTNEPFEILTKRNKLPDPNFVPKPILKKTEELPKEPKTKEATKSKIRTHSPMPQYRQPQNVVGRERSQSLIQTEISSAAAKSNTSPGSRKVFQRSISLNTKEEIRPLEQDLTSINAPPAHSISAVATICGITAASIVIPEELLKRKKNEEESKVVVDHYTDIVNSYGQRKKSYPQALPQSDNWKIAVKEKNPEQNKTLPLEEKPMEVKKEESEKQTKKHEIAPAGKDRSPSPTPQMSTAIHHRGRSINHGPRKVSTRSKTPSKSPSRLENWAGHSQRKTSPSPVKRNVVRKGSSPSPIPFAKPRPMLREIMTQTSIGFELNSIEDSGPRKSKQQELIARAEIKVRSMVDYVTDLAMFIVACWLYLFSNELFAIPILLIMVYRQIKDGIQKRIPKWILKRLTQNKSKKS